MSDIVARIKTVEAGSPADRAGIKAEEYVYSVNGQTAVDYIDWLWESDGTELELEVTDVKGKTRPVTLQRDGLQDSWGIEFDDLVYDGIIACENDCVFCFMKQLPATARKTLCVKDDDYRLSFLQGNFITLTNLEDDDKQRIIEQRISPLRLSFHAADKEVRQKLIGRNHAKALRNFDDLIEAGIDFHIQVVLVPGVNDGDVLEDTLRYLKDSKRLPHVLSVGIVPVAFTQYAPTRLKEMLGSASMVPADREEWSKSVIDQVQKHQFAEFEERELTWVYLADEFYIHAHAPFPLPDFYDGFPQLENGIGMVLNFIADIRDNLEDLQTALALLPQHNQTGSETITIVCGELLTQTWLGILSGIQAGGKLRLLPVKNRYFGGNVSVTGLLAGADILRAVKLDSDYLHEEGHVDAGKHLYLIPDCIFNADGITLDDYSADQLVEEAARQSVHITLYETNAAGLAADIRNHAKEQAKELKSDA
ncbi:MAG: DUF512 domain-containing protein [Coriobacteriia bacterium]|nr:DUF512 domain-containing protein [Coriobacteriia bacterium]MCL2745875.1 DUF512 domain-containing protein [Coriobacteriia bacterium]MCL2870329.1 DUF512 domain-containing protein [Coriobacteriia bacterium]